MKERAIHSLSMLCLLRVRASTNKPYDLLVIGVEHRDEDYIAEARQLGAHAKLPLMLELIERRDVDFFRLLCPCFGGYAHQIVDSVNAADDEHLDAIFLEFFIPARHLLLLTAIQNGCVERVRRLLGYPSVIENILSSFQKAISSGKMKDSISCLHCLESVGEYLPEDYHFLGTFSLFCNIYDLDLVCWYINNFKHAELWSWEDLQAISTRLQFECQVDGILGRRMASQRKQKIVEYLDALISEKKFSVLSLLE